MCIHRVLLYFRSPFFYKKRKKIPLPRETSISRWKEEQQRRGKRPSRIFFTPSGGSKLNWLFDLWFLMHFVPPPSPLLLSLPPPICHPMQRHTVCETPPLPANTGESIWYGLERTESFRRYKLAPLSPPVRFPRSYLIRLSWFEFVHSLQLQFELDGTSTMPLQGSPIILYLFFLFFAWFIYIYTYLLRYKKIHEFFSNIYLACNFDIKLD